MQDCDFDAENGVSIGSEMSGGVQDVLFEDCVSTGPSPRALSPTDALPRLDVLELAADASEYFGRASDR